MDNLEKVESTGRKRKAHPFSGLERAGAFRARNPGCVGNKKIDYARAL